MSDPIGRKRDWRPLLAAASLLFIGGVLGITFDRFHHRVTHVIVHRPPQQGTASFEMLDSALALRPEQRERVRAILEGRQPSVDTIWRHTHQSLRAALDSTIEQLDGVLDEAQMARLRELSSGLRNPGATPITMRH